MTDNNNLALSQGLILSLAEELKLPLLQIARRAELTKMTGESDDETIAVAANNAICLIDNYITGVKLAINPDNLNYETVSVSSVLYESAHELDGIAKLYGVELDLMIQGKFHPVTINREGLQAALTSLGMALIEALPGQETTQLKLHFATHRSRYGVVAGIYSDNKLLTNSVLKNGRRLQRKARQPLQKISHTNGAGIFVADSILNSMNLRLMTSRHHNLYGLGMVLRPNNQLRLV